MTDGLSVEEILATTRSVRRKIDFDKPIDRDTLFRCIDIAAQAPTGVGDESWRFVVLTDAQKKQALAELYRRAFDHFLEVRVEEMRAEGIEIEQLSPNYRYLADNLQAFPALVLVCREGRPPSEFPRQIAFYGSVLPAAWSLMIALRAQEIGSTWTTLHALYESEVSTLLGIPADATAAILLPIGYMKGAILRRAERRPAEEITYWEAWGGQPTGD